MDRRNFIQCSLLSVGAGVAAPQSVLAGSGDKASMAGGVFYTKEAPGRWSKKVGGHLPNIELEKTDGIVKVQVATAHEMNGYEHYIVKHVLLDQNYKFIDEYMFNPEKEKLPVSTFILQEYSGPLYALSLCNKHDLWLNGIEV